MKAYLLTAGVVYSITGLICKTRTCSSLWPCDSDPVFTHNEVLKSGLTTWCRNMNLKLEPKYSPVLQRNSCQSGLEKKILADAQIFCTCVYICAKDHVCGDYLSTFSNCLSCLNDMLQWHVTCRISKCKLYRLCNRLCNKLHSTNNNHTTHSSSLNQSF